MEAILMGGDSSDDDSSHGLFNRPPSAAVQALVGSVPTAVAPPPNATSSDVSKALRELYSGSKGQIAATLQQQQQLPQVQRPSQQQQQQIRPEKLDAPLSYQIPVDQQHLNQQHDPYATTPVYKMTEHGRYHLGTSGSVDSGNRQQPSSSSSSHLQDRDESVSRGRGGSSHRQQQQQQQHLSRPESAGSAVSGSSQTTVPFSNVSAPTSTPMAPAAARQLSTSYSQEQLYRLQKEKETFLVFTRVLIRFLEQKDPAMHQQVKEIIKECAERHKMLIPGYESLTTSMKVKLKEVVPSEYWNSADKYMKGYMMRRASTQGRGGGGDSSSSSSSSSQLHPPLPPQADQTSAPVEPNAPLPPLGQGSSSQQQAAIGTMHSNPLTISSLQRDFAAKREAIMNAGNSSLSATAPEPTTKPPSGSGAVAAALPISTPSQSSTELTAETKAPAPEPKRKKGGGTKASNRKQQTTKGSEGAIAQRKDSMVSTGTGGISVESGKTVPAPLFLAPPPAAEIIPPDVAKEYNEYMELLDHAMNIYDWTSSALILGPDTKNVLSEEQYALLFGCDQQPPSLNDPVSCFPQPGWSGRNVVSVRVLWAKVRLREPKVPIWFNEAAAEQDETLAAISEATQMYLRQVLEKGVHCVRQRQNVDGIRLWHQQVTSNSGKQLPLSLRLGCNVNRQLAMAEGNAAITVKRMEEVLERQTNMPVSGGFLGESALLQLGSIGDAALRPRLGKAVEDADASAKRSLQVCGSKDETSSPLGRLAKKTKLQIVDFQMGMLLSPQGYQRRNRASAVGGGFSF